MGLQFCNVEALSLQPLKHAIAYHTIAGFSWQGGRSAKGGGRVGADGGRAQSIFLGFAAGYERLRSSWLDAKDCGGYTQN